jgi:hypothetical protein
VIFLGGEFQRFCQKYFQPRIFCRKFHDFFGKKQFAQKDSQKNGKKLPTNMKRMLKILYFLILNIANLAKCTYGLSPLEQQYNFYFRKNTDSHVYKTLRELPQFYMFPCSHGNISFLGNEKEAGKSKQSCLHKGRFLYLCVPLSFPNSPRLPPLSAPPSGERTHMGTSPTT